MGINAQRVMAPISSFPDGTDRRRHGQIGAGWGTFPLAGPVAVARASEGLLPPPFWMNAVFLK